MECCYRLKLNQDDDVGNIHSGRIFSSRIWGACACATIVASQCAMPRWMDGGGGNVYMTMVHITKTDVKMHTDAGAKIHNIRNHIFPYAFLCEQKK